MSKASKQSRRLAQAKTLATGLVRRRKQLLALKAQLEKGNTLTEGQRAEFVNLVTRINSTKAAIKVLGFDPKEAVAWVSRDKKKVKRGSGKQKLGNRNGIGMYGLGSSIKVWK